MRTGLAFIVINLMALSVGCATDPLTISCKVRVPDNFQEDSSGWESPDGEPESVRYKRSYEAFWWNCLMVKAETFENKCPVACSGTPAATYGCFDGAEDAERKINKLIKVYGKMKVSDYLKTLTSNPEGLIRIRPYFPDGPRAD